MKNTLLLILTALLLAGCDIFKVAPQPFPVWTPIPSRTPGIFTATPNILIPSMTASSVSTLTASPSFVTEQPIQSSTPAPVLPASLTPAPARAMDVEILGCTTSVDISHGMGEVTNAYVILKNIGTEDLPDSCAMLRAADEEREHPDKSRCVGNLPAGYQVTLKLTVDSAYQEDTIIQVDASSAGALMLRVDKHSCKDIDLAGILQPSDLGAIKPINP
jgi:hypothetical protein